MATGNERKKRKRERKAHGNGWAHILNGRSVNDLEIELELRVLGIRPYVSAREHTLSHFPNDHA